MEPNICTNCRHSRIISIPDTPCASVTCKITYTIDPVDGHRREADCYKLRDMIGQNCPEYTEMFIVKLLRLLHIL